MPACTFDILRYMNASVAQDLDLNEKCIITYVVSQLSIHQFRFNYIENWNNLFFSIIDLRFECLASEERFCDLHKRRTREIIK